MAGGLARTYSDDEVRSLLQQCEVKLSPRSGRPGHAGSQHVDVSREGLREHADRDCEIELSTAFLRFDDQVQAATAILNHAQGQDALRYLEENRGTRRLTIEAPIPVTSVRCATTHRNWTQPLTAARMILDFGSHGRGLHIQTVYPVLELRRGMAAWWQG